MTLLRPFTHPARAFSALTACALMLALVLTGCDSGGSGMDDGGTVSEDIGAYLRGLSYSADDLLNVQETGAGETARTATAADTTVTQGSTSSETCIRTTYNLQQNFEDIAVLRPTADVLWPGALVEGNQSLMDGLPEPVRVARSPVTIRIDLPGIGSEGTRTIESPNLGTVQAEIDDALEWWNANAYQDGYVNASSSSNRITTSYRSTQAALDLGLNVEWATGDVSTQFNYETSETRRVVMASYKQAFYTVAFVQDPGTQPEDVFDPSVTIDEVQRAFDSSAPPAYIASVTYGRIIMFRMETSSSYTSADVEAAFRYAAGASVDGDLEARYQEILQESSVEVVTLGGNAAVASQAVSARSAGDLLPIIQGENAVYSRSNPGVPITYTVKYLQDDAIAKLGYTTEYTATECSTMRTGDTIRIFLDQFKVIKDCDGGLNGDGEWRFTAAINNGSTRVKTESSGDVTLGDGGTRQIDDETVFVAPRTPGARFSVTFTSTELDRDIFGNVFADDNMSGRRGSVVHEFGSTGWTNLNDGGSIIIRNGSGNCAAELWYTAAVR